MKSCSRWIADGQLPKKVAENKGSADGVNINMNLMSVVNSVIDNDQKCWYVDNGATSHVANTSEFFISFEHFTDFHTVTTANREAVQAVGKGNIQVEADVRGYKQKMILNDVWYVPFN